MPTGVYQRKKAAPRGKKVQSIPLAMIPAKAAPVARAVRSTAVPQFPTKDARTMLAMMLVQTVRDLMAGH